MRFPTPALLSLGVLVLLVLACGSTRNMVPEDASLAPGDEVWINAGASVTFLSFDGEPLDAIRLIAAPGPHEIEFVVRRNLRTVTDELAGVFHTSECTVALETDPGGSYLIRFAAKSETEASLNQVNTSIATRMLVEDRRSGEHTWIPCEFYYDCRRLKDTVRRSSMCRDYRTESGVGGG